MTIIIGRTSMSVPDPRRAAFLATALLLGLSGCTGPDRPDEDPAAPWAELPPAGAAADWVATNAIRLASVEAGRGFTDLAPLKGILADVRLVGLGEATHGTREIFQFKHRMVEFLVVEMGVTVFIIEASFPACLNVNRYVLQGEGDPAEALASIGFWTWDTQEVSDMIEWMRGHNETVPDERKVRFVGNDLQYIDESLDAVEAFLGQVAPDYVETARAAYDHVRIDPFEITAMASAPETEKQEILEGLNAVLGFLSLHEGEFVRRTSRAEYDLVLQHARIPAQFYDAYSRPMFDPEDPANTGAALRDVYMARNVSWVLETMYPGAKAVVWAHNGHVSKSVYGGAIPAMGSILREMYGDAYYTLGFDFDHGGFQARNLDPEAPDGEYGVLREFTVGPARDGTLAAALREAVDGDFLVDLRSVPTAGPVHEWMAELHPVASIGAGFSESQAEAPWRAPLVVTEHFDGLIFLHETTRARPNPSGERGPIPRESISG
jgi:erythromycin esterase